MWFSDYNPDEALRVTGITVMSEGHTYKFRVHNTGGKFVLFLEEHTLPGLDERKCKYAHDKGDPCSADGRNIKDAARESIAEHTRKFHFLSKVG